MRDFVQDTLKRNRLLHVLPLYLAAYTVLLCGLGSYLNTYDDAALGARSIAIVLIGMVVSLTCRLRQLRQNTMFGILAGMVVLILFWASVSGGAPPGQILAVLSNGRNSAPGLMLAWFLVLYSFAMIADEVIIFSVVPSIALLGLMASDNMNPEIVVYFLGLMVSAVFLLVYENMLSRGFIERMMPSGASMGEGAAPAGRLPAGENDPEEAGDGPVVEPVVRTSLMLTSVVALIALAVGFAVSVPLSYLGETVSTHAPQINIPAANEFAASITNRYINQLDLDGAPPRLSDREVMRVRSREPHYWRGRVFNRYTGFSWNADENVFPIDKYDGRNELRPLDGESWGEWKAREPVRQRVRMSDPPIGGMLVSAAEPIEVYTPAIVTQDRFRGIHTVSGQAGMDYMVISLVSVATPDELRHAGTNYPVALRSAYTQLEMDPDNRPAVRHQIAEEVTQGYATPYDKVKALETYLRSKFLYSLTPPRTPASEDAVTFFLTDSKEGYCEIFASTMAVLCREIGIPARLATGFAPGEWTPAEGHHRFGVSIVREKDLHAWTEVYFPGYGWIAFDPTASREAKVSTTATFTDFLRRLFAQVSQQSAGPSLILLSLAAVLLFLFKVYGLDPLRGSLWWRTLWARHHRSLSPEERWDLLYARSHRRLKRWAGLKAAHQTPFEYAEQAQPAVSAEAYAAFEALTHLYVDRAFQRGGPEAADVAALLEYDAALKAALKRQPRLAPATATA